MLTCSNRDIAIKMPVKTQTNVYLHTIGLSLLTIYISVFKVRVRMLRCQSFVRPVQANMLPRSFLTYHMNLLIQCQRTNYNIHDW